ncbi:MAG: phasin family protein [Betaproteobacteria bacterium]|nr:phasin family protein [Betaproteobacteria bacterium]
MYNTPEQVTEFNRSALDAALQLSKIALDTTERLVGLQLVATKETLAEASQSLGPLIEARDLQALLDLRTKLTGNGIENAAAYSRGLYDVATYARAQISALFKGHLAALNQSVTGNMDREAKAAPADADDNMVKTTEQKPVFSDVSVKTTVDATPAARKPKPAARKQKPATRARG